MLQDALHGCDTDAAVAAALRAFEPTFKPSRPSVTKLISKYSRGGYWRRGVSLYRHLHILGVDVDLPIGNAALWACSRGGDAAEACRIFQEVRGLREKPDRISYRALIHVLAAQGRWASCVQAYIDSLNDGVPLEGDACLFMLIMLRRAGLWQLAEACLLAAFCKDSRRGPFGDLTAALEGTATPVLAVQPGVDASVANALLQRLQEASQPWRVLSAAPGVATDGARSTRGSAGSREPRAHGGADHGGDGDASGFAEEALVTPCCDVLLQAYAEAAPPQPGRALALLCAMSSAHEAAPAGGAPVQPSALSFGLVASAHCRAGDVARGLAVLSAYARSGQPPPAAAYAPCMAAAASAGDAAAAVDVWCHMHAHGVHPDDGCRTAFIRAAARSGYAGFCEEAVPVVLLLSRAAIGTACVQYDVAAILLTLAQHSAPLQAVAAFQGVLAAGVPVPSACVTECVRQMEGRDALCCAALRQTAAAAGFRRRTAHAYE